MPLRVGAKRYADMQSGASPANYLFSGSTDNHQMICGAGDCSGWKNGLQDPFWKGTSPKPEHMWLVTEGDLAPVLERLAVMEANEVKLANEIARLDGALDATTQKHAKIEQKHAKLEQIIEDRFCDQVKTLDEVKAQSQKAIEATTTAVLEKIAVVTSQLDASVAALELLSSHVQQNQRDAELLWDLHRKAEHLGDKTFLTTNFKRFYAKSRAAKTPEAFWDASRRMVAHFYKTKGVGALAVSKADDFVKGLKDEVVNAPSSAPASMLDSPAWLATRCWTAAQKDPIFLREWCGLLNQMVREDNADLMPEVCTVIATMAGYNVFDRNKALPPIAWPKKTEGDQIAWTLTRGGRMPDEHVEWYKTKIGETIRIPMNLATTKDTQKSKDFMNTFSYPEDAPKVMFYLELDEHVLCDHVNCLESLTLVSEEQEFLFPPYSCFKIKSVEACGAFTKITLTVVSDNTKEPENAPLAPWA